VRIVHACLFALLAPVVTGVCFVLATVALVFDPGRGRVSHAFARLWGRALCALAGARLVVTGADRLAPREARVIVGNHASYLDITAMIAVFPGQLRFVARKSLFWLPFIGWYIRLAGHFSIDREDPRQALALADRMADRMRRRGLSPMVFPEGTRSRDGRLAAFKTGAFHLPVSLGVAVQPVAILGSNAILPKGAWVPRRPGVLELRVGEALPTTGLEGSSGRKEVAERARDALLRLGVPDGLASPPT
jgi:1-acyl-sn-glycerol-3-phosphate acyltransferase